MTAKKKAAKKTTKKRRGKQPGSGRKGGRPTEYQPDKYPEMAMRHCLLGATNDQLADLLQVSRATINGWMAKYPAFLGAIRDGRANADAHVANSLYHRALGYSHPEDKVFCNQGEITVVPTIKRYPPDTGAAFIWLKNRRPDMWRDRKEITGPDGGPIQVERIERVLIGVDGKVIEGDCEIVDE